MPFLLKQELATLSEEDYNYVFCDCPPNLLHFTKLGLFASDYVIIPLEPEPLALEGLTQLVQNILPDIMKTNPSLKIGGVVIVHQAPRTRKYLPAQARAHINTILPGLLFPVEIPLDVNIADAPNYHRPVCVFAEDSMGSWYFEALADQFMQRIPSP